MLTDPDTISHLHDKHQSRNLSCLLAELLAGYAFLNAVNVLWNLNLMLAGICNRLHVFAKQNCSGVLP